MLDTPDTETVRSWLTAALASGESSGKSAAELARLCGVTPQAVNGWKRTGRIKKSHLERASQYFGHGPNFGGALAVNENSPPYQAYWPFPRIEIDRFRNLPISERDKIESHALFVITEWEQARLSSAESKIAAHR